MNGGDYLQIDSEILNIIDVVNSTSLLVNRAEVGTSGATHSSGATVEDIQDWIFMSIQAGGSATGCSTGCLYNFNVISGAASGTPTTSAGQSGGTSGLVVDNLTTSQTGGGEIYFSTLNSSDDAVQDTQISP